MNINDEINTLQKMRETFAHVPSSFGDPLTAAIDKRLDRIFTDQRMETNLPSLPMEDDYA